ncbi:uncharacterized protein LOC121513124 [Xyrichtys novacula]|uniref:Uncharacterized protein LOC121513124 n=1 Tax=Xyrichtys novacula TaxID=13765 RepID=A0AAV1FLI7_XYRNO|nr:uncharacterized protein LOC121513124 [Xyrichtys novacula]
MSLVVYLLWTLLIGSLGGPAQLAVRTEGLKQVQAVHDGDAHPPYYRLPVFLQSRGPLVDRNLFLPVPYKRPLPAEITALLLPQTPPQRSVQGTGTRAVEVWCGGDQVAVRVDRLQLSAWPVPSLFSLGSCGVSKVSPRYLYFHSRLTDCGGEAQVVGGQLVYTFTLCYTPPSQGLVIRFVPLTLPISCHYNRFHHSYKVGFRPQVQHKTFLKSIRSKLSFSLTICNAQWEPLPSGHWFILGEPVYFMAQTGALLASERLNVDFCYATSSKDPNSQPRMDIIANYGCMTDSRREGSSSHFMSAGGAVVKFAVDAFLFKAVSHELYLHCSMSISLITSASAKSCNFNRAAGRWEELETTPSVCTCCDSLCTDGQDAVPRTVSSQGWFIGQKSQGKPRMRAISFQAEEGREWEDPIEEETTDKRMEEMIKVRSFPPSEMEIIGDKEKDGSAPAERKKWRSSSVADQQEVEEEDRLMTESAKEGNETILGTERVQSSSVNASEEASGNKTVKARNSTSDYSDPSHRGSVGNVSTAVTFCSGGNNTNCSDGSAVSAVTPSKERDTANITRSGSGWDSSVQQSPFGSEFHTLVRSEQVESVNRSADTKSEQVLEPASGSAAVHRSGVDDEMLHSLQIRGLEPDQIRDPIRGVFGDSGFDSGRAEGGTLHLGQFVAVEKSAGPRSASSDSAGSKFMHQNSPGYSSVVTVTDSLHDAERSDWFNRAWAEGWNMKRLWFMRNHQTDLDDFY